MKAYTGGKLLLGNFYAPVVVDLTGLKVSAKSRPILRDHDPSQIVGHTESVKVTEKAISVKGTVSAANDHAREVAESSDNGFPWQASIGANAQRMVYVDKGETVRVNGQRFTGPLYVARQSTLGEVSFVALGADDRTTARMVANAAGLQTEIVSMRFEEWIAAKGMTLADLTEDTVKALRAMFDAEVQASAGGSDEDDDDDAVQAAAGNDGASTDGAIDAIRAEATRINAINAACTKHPKIAAKAIAEGWDDSRAATEVELVELRAGRPTAPNINTGAGGPDRMSVIEAGLLLAGKTSDAEAVKDTSEGAVEAASKEFGNSMGLQEMLLAAAIENGYQSRRISAVKTDLGGVLRAAFSTLSLPGILGNTANKFVLAGFNAVEDSWRAIASKRAVTDFKTITSYRLTGDHEYEQVGPDGELKHGSVGEASLTNKADTYGKMFAITRTDIINDDLGLLTQLPRRIGRGAALKLNTVFWTEFMDNSSFFTAGRGNYEDGASTALDIDALTAAELLFLDQTDDDSQPVGINPAILLVPNALLVTASNLMNSTQVNNGSTSDTPVNNPHAGKFDVVKSSYLGNTGITGNSVLAWYLLADPEDVPVIEVAFLNGNETPTVESADADFNTLGIQMRGFHDFGASKQEYRGGVKEKGEA